MRPCSHFRHVLPVFSWIAADKHLVYPASCSLALCLHLEALLEFATFRREMQHVPGPVAYYKRICFKNVKWSSSRHESLNTWRLHGVCDDTLSQLSTKKTFSFLFYFIFLSQINVVGAAFSHTELLRREVYMSLLGVIGFHDLIRLARFSL